MSFDRGFCYVTWGGKLGTGGQEQWQNGVKLAPDTAGSTAALPTPAQAATIMTNLQAQWILTANLIGSSAFLQYMKFSKMDKDGHLIGEPVIAATNPTAGVAGPATTNPHPFQAAVVATLWSGGTFGKANYGRIYLPDPRVVIQTDGQMGGTLKPWVDWVATWLKTIEANAATWPDGQAPMYVMIMHNATGTATGISRHVQAVRMGSVMDTQRRRRNNLKETITTATTYP